jgi:uncharacterized protein (DUF1330 family)
VPTTDIERVWLRARLRVKGRPLLFQFTGGLCAKEQVVPARVPFKGRKVVKTHYKIVLAMLASAALGALAVQGLHAQAKPPVYTVTEIDISDVDAYVKDYAPLAQAAIKKSGGKLLAAGQKVTTIEGAPVKTRVAIQVWDSLEQAQAWRTSAEYKKAREIGDKYAKFRAFAVEGMPQ